MPSWITAVAVAEFGTVPVLQLDGVNQSADVGVLGAGAVAAGATHVAVWAYARVQPRKQETRERQAKWGLGREVITPDDNPDSRTRYRGYLAWQAEQGPAGKSKAYVSLSKGWVVGSKGFKSTLLPDHAMAALSRAWERDGAGEIQVHEWERLLGSALLALGRSGGELETKPKAQGWKLAVAVFLKEHSQASNVWLAKRLRLGTAKYASHLISKMRNAPSPLAELIRLRQMAYQNPRNGNKAT
jgi:hypothetical protein